MNKTQVIFIVIDTMIMMLAVWNLVLALQNMKIDKIKSNIKRGK